ncbi:Cotton fiber expressed protein [Musa troglodytarum]|uniref:Cotton fiber expressed protein n=1 Tax=Musa troglodytarum TaxID=320322 RepID=A0A9E7I3H8_9LILI|nr:Cotton fiber expressed protein [Musa troglodytarum]
MCGWFTPAVLFLLLNLVIGSIAVASKSSHHRAAAGDDGAAYPGRFLARSPSIVLHRLLSFNLHRCSSGEIPPPSEASDHHPERSGRTQSDAGPPSPSAQIKKSASDHHPEHSGWTQSDAEMPPRLSVQIKKSASEAEIKKSASEAAAAARETVDPAEGDCEEDVDARADDFINRFRRQLMMQRMASITRQRATPSGGR